MENLVADQPKRLCIVSRDRLRREPFIAALQGSLSTADDLQIIVDRRRVGSSGVPELKEDRRRQQQADLALEASGFAIVPVSVEPAVDRTSFAPLFPVVPIERLSPEEPPRPQEDGGGDEQRESIRSFRRWWSGVIPEVIGVLSGVTLAALVLLLAGQFIGRNLISELFMGPSSGPGQPPGQTNERFTSARLPTVTEEVFAPETRPSRAATPSSARPNNESSSIGGPASAKPVSPRDGERLTPRQRETSGPSKPTDSASREPGATSRESSAPPKETSASLRSASTPANEAGAAPEAGAGQGASIDRTRSSAAVRPSPSAPEPSNQVASAPSPPAAASNAAPPLAGSHRAELVRGPVSRGWGDSYVVRLLDPAGRPMVAFEILLVAQMADGTVEKSPMGALPERGTYRATVPTSRSTPVDLRVRVSTGEKFVEVPVRR
jgi:hypothetical protein